MKQWMRTLFPTALSFGGAITEIVIGWWTILHPKCSRIETSRNYHIQKIVFEEVCVCVCVSERERERERQRATEGFRQDPCGVTGITEEG